jgi:glycosyltransferase involved in cell wall biosynthesis
MGLSIITPHYNDLEGLKRIYSCLQEQTNAHWEWVIVDDVSEKSILNEVKAWYDLLVNEQVKLICNSDKTNASVCRNLGANAAENDIVVFLDADDYMTSDFVANRQVEVVDFVVFKNTAIDDKYEGVRILPKTTGNYLDHFLKAQFIWPITSILWNREFFNTIGEFDDKLPRLQDVELSIRALQKSTSYRVLDNSVDFYYRVKPIRERKNFVQPVCDSVYLFISELLDTSNFTKDQLTLISSYYYLCVKYFARSGHIENVELVNRNLKLFYKKSSITLVNFLIGFLVLKLYSWKIISKKFFLRTNRYVFKPKQLLN